MKISISATQKEYIRKYFDNYFNSRSNIHKWNESKGHVVGFLDFFLKFSLWKS